MEIVIRSEIDSRNFIYPMLSCLRKLGSVCLFTDNHMCNRLVDEDNDVPGFANFEVYPLYPNFNGDLESAIQESEYEKDKWDYIIWDNVGRMEYDVQLAIFSNKVSERLFQDMMYVIDEEGVHIIKMGSPAKVGKTEKKPKPQKEKGKKKNVDEDVDLSSVSKWNTTKTDEEVFEEKLNTSGSKWIPFPTAEEIEAFEGRHIFMTPNQKFIDVFYDIIKDNCGLDKRAFMKGVKLKDENRNFVSGIDVR